MKVNLSLSFCLSVEGKEVQALPGHWVEDEWHHIDLIQLQQSKLHYSSHGTRRKFTFFAQLTSLPHSIVRFQPEHGLSHLPLRKEKNSVPISAVVGENKKKPQKNKNQEIFYSSLCLFLIMWLWASSHYFFVLCFCHLISWVDANNYLLHSVQC